MTDSRLRGPTGELVRAGYPGVKTPVGDYEYRIPQPEWENVRKPDKSPEELKDEAIGAAEKGKKYAEKFGEYSDKLKDYSKKKADWLSEFGEKALRGRKGAPPFGKKPIPLGLVGDVVSDILLNPVPAEWGEDPTDPPGPPNLPPDPPDIPLGPPSSSICGKGELDAAFYAGEGHVAQIGIYKVENKKQLWIDEYGVEREETHTRRKIGTVKYYFQGSEAVFRDSFNGRSFLNAVSPDGYYGTSKSLYQSTSNWKYELQVDYRRSWINYASKYTGYTFLYWTIYQKINGDWRIVDGDRTSHWYYIGKIECIVPVKKTKEREDPIEPNDYNREEDDEDMGKCKWQTDEISYELPKLKIGNTEVGGNSISIDDGLLPLAQYLCKSLELMHNGIGLNLLDDKEFPVNLGDKDGAKIKPSSLAQLSQWQFDNVSSLVGLPVKNTITNLDNDTKDLKFKNIQDCLSYLVHKQREGDNDLMVIENYATRIATQLEAVTSIALRQHADIEMLIQEMGFRFKWKTETRPCLYKTGMKDDDEKTGIMELFKGGTVSYPVRIWDDSLDQRQIALKTNLYAEISAKSTLQQINTDTEIPGLDARIKMGKENKENWLEWIKTINEPEKGVVSGSRIPYIEEYTKGTIEAKKIKAPEKGLSLFMKPAEPKKASSGKPKTVEPTKPQKNNQIGG